MLNFDDFLQGKSDLTKKLKLLMNPIVSMSNPMDKFKEAMREWFNDFESLKKLNDSELSPELRAEKYTLINRGQSIINKIKILGITADTFKASNLGFVPIIAGGVIVTAAGLMVYWTTDFLKFKERFAEYKTLRASGMSHDQAKKVVNEIESKNSIFDNLSGVAKNAAIAAGLFVAYKIAKSKGFL